MTRLFLDEGVAIPVTVIQAGPCTVVQKKTVETDGYEAIQLGFGDRKKVTRPLAGHFRAAGGGKFAVLKEFEAEDIEQYDAGSEVTLDIFQIGEKISVIGQTKGRGFAGVIKRHGFGGGRATHGCTTHRSPGSIGSSAWPSRVFPGKKMPGHYGDVRQTTRNLEIVDIRDEYGVILVKGAVPGPTNSIVLLKKD